MSIIHVILFFMKTVKYFCDFTYDFFYPLFLAHCLIPLLSQPLSKKLNNTSNTITQTQGLLSLSLKQPNAPCSTVQWLCSPGLSLTMVLHPWGFQPSMFVLSGQELGLRAQHRVRLWSSAASAQSCRD